MQNDFSTLYTKLPHDRLLDVLEKIISLCFKGGTRKRVCIDYQGQANWLNGDNKKKHYSFDKDTILNAVKYLIHKCNFSIGNVFFQQIIGIPMGGDPAPFWANLFVFHYESQWLQKMRKSHNILARKFGNTHRYIDDLVAINDGGALEKHHKEIYPPELILKKENKHNVSASFLDLQIDIEDRKFVAKIYDMRDNFSFKIVRLPYRMSNIESMMFYSSIAAELLRICRVTSKLDGFINSSKILIKRMYQQGAIKDKIDKTCLKIFNRHTNLFEKYRPNNREIILYFSENYCDNFVARGWELLFPVFGY